jgi:hypothetical protein
MDQFQGMNRFDSAKRMPVFIDHGSCDDDERGRRAPHGIAGQDALRVSLYVRLHRTLYPTFGKPRDLRKQSRCDSAGLGELA